MGGSVDRSVGPLVSRSVGQSVGGSVGRGWVGLEKGNKSNIGKKLGT